MAGSAKRVFFAGALLGAGLLVGGRLLRRGLLLVAVLVGFLVVLVCLRAMNYALHPGQIIARMVC